MWTFIVFVAGVVVGTVGHVIFFKWYHKAKKAAQEVASDVQAEIKRNRPS